MERQFQNEVDDNDNLALIDFKTPLFCLLTRSVGEL